MCSSDLDAAPQEVLKSSRCGDDNVRAAGGVALRAEAHAAVYGGDSQAASAGDGFKLVGDLASVDGDLYSAVYNSDSVGVRRFTISHAQDAGNVFTYVLGRTGEDAVFQVAGANGESLYVASEGGEIAIDQLMGTAQPISGSAESAPQFAATSASAEVQQGSQPDDTAALAAADISGELARAVIFEVIDGQAVPIVYAASDGDGGYMVTGQYIASAADSGRHE